MSTKRGNNSKKGQRHQNTKAYKNDLHDTSKKTKQINRLVVGGVCARCREIIEWRKKFNKYKPLAAPRKCVRCEQKVIKHAYHTVCSRCAQEAKVCEKCGQAQVIVAKIHLNNCIIVCVRSEPTPSERASEDSMLQQEIKAMTERQRRTFFRRHEKGSTNEGTTESASLQDSPLVSNSTTSDLSISDNDDELSESDEQRTDELGS